MTLHRLGKVECDYLACGFGLVPNTELLTLLGGPGNGIYAAGEVTGIGGLELSVVEGESPDTWRRAMRKRLGGWGPCGRSIKDLRTRSIGRSH